MMSSVASGRKSETGTFLPFAKLGVAVCMIACALGAPARAGCKVAVIDGPDTITPVMVGQLWCEFLNENGHECTLFPITGPTASLDPFQVIFNLSNQWTDPAGSLAGHLRAGKTVITWGFAPDALGIDTNPEVQAWIGATGVGFNSGKLMTVAIDPIFGTMPPGSEILDCALALCTALLGTESFPNSKVLARLEGGNGWPGIHRNSWEDGRSFYFWDWFGPGSQLHEEIMLRTLEESCRPIPAVSTWGVLVFLLVIAIGGSLIVRYRHGALAGGRQVCG
jgi:hypothetical protein